MIANSFLLLLHCSVCWWLTQGAICYFLFATDQYAYLVQYRGNTRHSNPFSTKRNTWSKDVKIERGRSTWVCPGHKLRFIGGDSTNGIEISKIFMNTSFHRENEKTLTVWIWSYNTKLMREKMCYAKLFLHIAMQCIDLDFLGGFLRDTRLIAAYD